MVYWGCHVSVQENHMEKNSHSAGLIIGDDSVPELPIDPSVGSAPETGQGSGTEHIRFGSSGEACDQPSSLGEHGHASGLFDGYSGGVSKGSDEGAPLI